MKTARHLFAVALGVAIAVLQSPADAAPGDLDPSFGTGGKVTTPFGPGTIDGARAMVVQPDGRIVLAGRTYNGPQVDFALARYLASGALDVSFNATGKVTTSFGTSLDSANGLALQPDGKIVAAGGTGTAVAIARYLPNGSLDASFSGDGKQETALGLQSAGAAVAIQADGKIVVAGASSNGGSSSFDFLLLRYLPNGNLDTSFGAGTGWVTTPIGTSTDFGNALALQSDGKIVVAGSTYTTSVSNDDIALARYLPNGTLDSSFNGTGKVVTEVRAGQDVATGVVVQPDGRIVIAGFAQGSSTDMVVLRYLANGTPDPVFGVMGKAIVDIAGDHDICYDLALQSDGKIVLAGAAGAGSFRDMALARLLSNGTLDGSFHGTGKKAFPLSATNDEALAIAIQSDDKIVAAGYANDGTTDDFAVIRLIDGVILPPTLTAPGDGTRTKSPVSVSFSLPEAAAPGSVTLRFGATVLTLATSQEAAGPHSFTFDPANPLGAPGAIQAVANGPIVDGTYTVMLSYRDTAGNPAATDTSTNVIIDTKPPAGGNFALTPAVSVSPGAAMSATANSWTDPRTPLSYQFILDGTPLGPRGASASVNFTAPASLGTHTTVLRVFDALDNVAEVSRAFVVNDPPAARAATLGATGGSTASIAVAKLLAYASDPNGDALAIVAVSATSAQGGTVTLSNGIIRYTPPASFSGADSFTYTLQDARGGTVTGIVNVTVAPGSGPSLNVVSITPTADGFLVRFAGIPGASYRIQYRDALTDAWQLLDPPGAIQSGPNGLFEHEDKPNPKPASRFYRAIAP